MFYGHKGKVGKCIVASVYRRYIDVGKLYETSISAMCKVFDILWIKRNNIQPKETRSSEVRSQYFWVPHDSERNPTVTQSNSKNGKLSKP